MPKYFSSRFTTSPVVVAHKLGFGAVAMGNDDTNRCVVGAGVTRVNDVHWADRDRNKIAGQWLGFRKPHCLHAAGTRPFRKHRGVRKCAIVAGNVQRDLPGHFVTGLVKTRESPSCRDIFELGIEKPILAVLDLENPGPVLAADFALAVDVQLRRARTHRMVERKANEILRLRDYFGGQRLTVHGQGCVRYSDLLGVQPSTELVSLKLRSISTAPAKVSLSGTAVRSRP
jgi:hypothetical protein